MAFIQNGGLECGSMDKYTAKKEEKRVRQKTKAEETEEVWGRGERLDCVPGLVPDSLCGAILSLPRSSLSGSLVLYSEFPDEAQCCVLYFMFFFFPYFT